MRLKKRDRIKTFRDWYHIIVRMKIVKKTEDYIKKSMKEKEERKIEERKKKREKVHKEVAQHKVEK